MKIFTVGTKDRLSGIAHGTGWMGRTEKHAGKEKKLKEN